MILFPVARVYLQSIRNRFVIAIVQYAGSVHAVRCGVHPHCTWGSNPCVLATEALYWLRLSGIRRLEYWRFSSVSTNLASVFRANGFSGLSLSSVWRCSREWVFRSVGYEKTLYWGGGVLGWDVCVVWQSDSQPPKYTASHSRLL
jgi:hypothetical protein